MRLTAENIRQLKQLAMDEAGPSSRLRLFGSRLDDQARGGDVDLLLELSDPVEAPAPWRHACRHVPAACLADAV